MRTDRRTFLSLGLGAGLLAAGALAGAARRGKIAAIALDGFVVFDPRPVGAKCEALFPGRGAELVGLWRTRQFEYTWLRTLSRRYVPFWQVTDEALGFALRSLELEASSEKRAELMDVWNRLPLWPDAAARLAKLKDAGMKLAFLTNLTEKMLDAILVPAGVRGLFGEHLSTDRVGAYKPDPRAYQMGIDAFGLPKERILFAASAGWDAAGAKAFGYQTVWVNRLGAAPETLGAEPDAISSDMAVLDG